MPYVKSNQSQKLVSILEQSDQGLNIHEILENYYLGFHSGSYQMQYSLRKRMEKIIQRSRTRLSQSKAPMTIFYDKMTNKYKIYSS